MLVVRISEGFSRNKDLVKNGNLVVDMDLGYGIGDWSVDWDWGKCKIEN